MGSNDEQYTWTVGDVRGLDQRLGSIESNVASGINDIREIRDSLNTKDHLVIDNSGRTDWKAVGALAIAVLGALGTLYLTIRNGQ